MLSCFDISILRVLWVRVDLANRELCHADLTSTSWSFRLLFIAMRKMLLPSVALLILAGILGGQITELFDHWDHTLQTGRDVDYTVVVIAACVGVVFAVGKKLVSVSWRFLVPVKNPSAMTSQLFSWFRTTSAEPLATGPPISALSPLRI